MADDTEVLGGFGSQYEPEGVRAPTGAAMVAVLGRRLRTSRDQTPLPRGDQAQVVT